MLNKLKLLALLASIVFSIGNGKAMEREEEEYLNKLIKRCQKKYPHGFTKNKFCILNTKRYQNLKDYFEDLLLRGGLYEESKGLYKFSSIINERLKK